MKQFLLVFLSDICIEKSHRIGHRKPYEEIVICVFVKHIDRKSTATHGNLLCKKVTLSAIGTNMK